MSYDEQMSKADLILRDTGEIKNTVKAQHDALGVLQKNMMKIFFGLLAVAGTGIGVKFVGTPLITDIMAYVTLGASIFLALSTWHGWRKLLWIERITRIIFVLFMACSGYGRGVLFQSGRTLAPIWYGPMVDTFFILIATCLCIRIIQGKTKDKNGNHVNLD